MFDIDCFKAGWYSQDHIAHGVDQVWEADQIVSCSNYFILVRFGSGPKLKNDPLLIDLSEADHIFCYLDFTFFWSALEADQNYNWSALERTMFGKWIRFLLLQFKYLPLPPKVYFFLVCSKADHVWEADQIFCYFSSIILSAFAPWSTLFSGLLQSGLRF